MKGTDIVFILVAWTLVLGWTSTTLAAEEMAEEEKDNVQYMEEMVVKEKTGAPGVAVMPEKTEVDLSAYRTVGTVGTVTDVLKTRAIVDFRGESDLAPGVDNIYLRGFDAKRFVVAIDGITIQKTGGRKSSNIIDYALLPTFIIDKIEILPGPHSALYDSKSIGGVINLIASKPQQYESLKPEVALSTSFRSYNTQVHNAMIKGGVDIFTYDLGYRKNSTDGYLRHSKSDIDNLFGRLGLLLPGDGFVTLSTSYSDVDRDAPVNNTAEGGKDYDDDYPEAAGGQFDPYQEPTWNGLANAYRLNYEQSLPIGRLTFGAYYSEESRDRTYYEAPEDTARAFLNTEWVQQGGKIQDEIQWAENHATTLGFDFAQMYDDGVDNDKTERINKKGGCLQHQWGILPSFDLTLGARYEDVKVWVGNWSNGRFHIPGRDKYIERDWSQWVPKSFATWKMDGLTAWLRDTSLSLGISKIWRAPDYHGDYNPQGRPAGAWIDPEHGIGYDLVFNRRLWGNFAFKVNYAFYDIEDFIATNSEYAQYTPPRTGEPSWNPRLNYSDYKINLKEVYRHGVDLELGGNLTEALSLYLSYAWQTFENKGDEYAGKTELDGRAENRLNAGVRYAFFEKTTLMLDYYYQSEEITEDYDDETDYFRQVKNDPYHLVDIGLSRKLLESKGIVGDVVLTFYVKNIFDEEYYDASGFPATDRTYGVGLSFDI